jgi:protoporphyrin/coproporphyrin ferrochelatase
VSAPRRALLLVNLGSPSAPTPRAVRRYLAQFLGDQRVVELPRALWRPLLHGIVLRTRPARSAAKYREIWTADGPPLLVHTRAQARGVAAQLRHTDLTVAWATTYGEPGVGARVAELLADGVTQLAVLPLFPQYAASTTGAVFDAVARALARARRVPELRFAADFHLDPGYLDALASQILAHWARAGRGEHLVLSFHGIPERTAARGDPYPQQCAATAQALADLLGLRAGEWTLAYQSRFGRARWLGPATQRVVDARIRAGARRLDVFCPGFVVNCPETLEELGIALRARAQRAGAELRVAPCLNADTRFVAALAQIGLGLLGEGAARTQSARLTVPGTA